MHKTIELAAAQQIFGLLILCKLFLTPLMVIICDHSVSLTLCLDLLKRVKSESWWTLWAKENKAKLSNNTKKAK